MTMILGFSTLSVLARKNLLASLAKRYTLTDVIKA